MERAYKYISLINHLAMAGKETFETSEIKEMTGLSAQATSNVLSRLVRQGLVDRVAQGRYALRPIGALGTRAASEDIALAVSAAFGDRPHRIAYRSALEYHDLLDHPARQITVALDRGTSLKELSGRDLRVVTEHPDRVDVDAIEAGHGARVSSIGRALLESAGRPQLAGGIQVVANALALADVDPQSLKQTARALKSPSALQRLGSLAEALNLRGIGSALEPAYRWQRTIPLDPVLNDDEDDGERWVDRKWAVEWPFSRAELEEAVRR